MRSVFRSVLVALMAVMALAAVTTASASATTLHWSQCQIVEGTGSYNSPQCQESGSSNSYNWVQIPAGVRRNMTTSSGAFFIKGAIAGVKMTVECHESSSGWVENPEGGAAGRGSMEFSLTGCTTYNTKTKEALGCVTPKPVQLAANTELLANGSTDELKLTPSSGSKFGEVTFERCSNAMINGTYPVEGSFKAVVSSLYSKLEFTKTGSEATMGGNAATIEGTAAEEIEGGEPELSLYGCEKQVGGKYKDGTCGEEGGLGGYGWIKLPEGKKTNLKLSSNNLSMRWEDGGIKWVVRCENGEYSGFVENKSPGAPAVGSITAKLNTCFVEHPEATECKVKPKEFTAPMEVLISGGVPYEKFSGNFSFVREGCTNSGLNGEYPVKGSFRAAIGHLPELEFNKSTSELIMGGIPFWFQGSVKQELEGGGYLRNGLGPIGVRAT